MGLAILLAQATNDPGLVEACGPKGDQGWICSTVYRVTGSQGAAEVADALSKPIRVLVILLVAWIVVRIGRRLISRMVVRMSGGVEKLVTKTPGVSFVDTGPMSSTRRVQRAETVGAVLRSIVSIVVWTIAIFSALEVLGVNLAPLLATAGVAGIAIAFGAQSLVKDFLTGMFMLVEDQFAVGDVVDLGVASGTVEGISLRTTRLRDVDGVVWHVPNGTVLRVGNKSQQWSRAVVDIPVAYEADLAQATEVIREVAEALWHDDHYAPYILAEPSVLGVESMAPGRVMIRVVIRTQPQQELPVARALRLRVKAALDAAGIAAPTIP
ncbi:MAG: mechanosensitive ion channel family protein [Acidimicrobiia bacterium]